MIETYNTHHHCHNHIRGMKVIELLPLESSIDDAFDEENRSALFTTEQLIIYRT